MPFKCEPRISPTKAAAVPGRTFVKTSVHADPALALFQRRAGMPYWTLKAPFLFRFNMLLVPFLSALLSFYSPTKAAKLINIFPPGTTNAFFR